MCVPASMAITPNHGESNGRKNQHSKRNWGNSVLLPTLWFTIPEKIMLWGASNRPQHDIDHFQAPNYRGYNGMCGVYRFQFLCMT